MIQYFYRPKNIKTTTILYFTRYDLIRYGDGEYAILDLKKNKTIGLGVNRRGYLCCQIIDDRGKWIGCMFHRIILSNEDPDGYFEGAEVNHIDEVKTNNKLENLEWISCKDNINHGTHNQRSADKRRGKKHSKEWTEKIIETNTKLQGKPVGMYSKNGELIKIYRSQGEAERDGFAQSKISACCRGTRKSHKGFIWKFIEKE